MPEYILKFVKCQYLLMFLKRITWKIRKRKPNNELGINKKEKNVFDHAEVPFKEIGFLSLSMAFCFNFYGLECMRTLWSIWLGKKIKKLCGLKNVIKFKGHSKDF